MSPHCTPRSTVVSTWASISSRIESNSFELRRRQISIQQKLVRQMRDTTRSFCVSNQQAQPRCLPLTKRLVNMFVELCITFSPASAKSSTKTKITYPFLCFLCFKCALTPLCRSINLSNVSGSQVSHIVCSSSGTRMCTLTCFRQASHAGSMPGAQLGENTYTLE